MESRSPLHRRAGSNSLRPDTANLVRPRLGAGPLPVARLLPVLLCTLARPRVWRCSCHTRFSSRSTHFSSNMCLGVVGA